MDIDNLPQEAPHRPDLQTGVIPAGQVGEGAEGFTHSGRTYILGWGRDFFGLWDRNRVGGPIFRSRRSRTGWKRMWSRFTKVEDHFVPVESPGVASLYRKWSWLALATFPVCIVAFIAGANGLLPIYARDACTPEFSAAHCDRGSLAGVLIALGAVGIGLVAVSRIKRSGGSLRGKALAWTGFGLGLFIVLMFLPVLWATAYSWLLPAIVLVLWSRSQRKSTTLSISPFGLSPEFVIGVETTVSVPDTTEGIACSEGEVA